MANAGSDPARSIPMSIKRTVLQRCGFGCVFCGLPLYEYEHMAEWAKVKTHNAEDITLLCDRHHKEKTNGWLPVEKVRLANANPYNLRTGATEPFLFHFSGPTCTLEIGNNLFTALASQNYVLGVVIDGQVLFGFRLEDGNYLLHARLFDEYNNLTLLIVDNELVMNSSVWDIELVGTELTIRTASRSILLVIRFNPPGHLHIVQGRLLLNGVELFINPIAVSLLNNNLHVSSSWIKGVNIAFALGTNQLPLSAAYGADDLPRNFDRPAALRRAARARRRLR